ncbi:serine hydrolase domain-containing protein [Wenjunlia tyrosinilytica]|uniref:D-alanyl-D-alanine carboxypeptidase n=1 Tax=Wenjunlia tyrosinilytica TaxID=1544741 RepID=A0A918DXY9_9ACTN|nr:serine hydrolase domain-containing protein [Wenjunlia tyrosinilytica]GGO90395.1 D-alanyl-D-alanine carboxypeptidase [Wenjunlia tyrosinilytica]
MPARTRLAGMTAVVAMTAGALAAPAVAAPAPAGDHHAPTRRAMEAAVKQGVPGVTGQVKDKQGTWNGTAGVGDIKSGRPRGAHDHYRVGSITKTFVSTVVLQLEAEGRLNLNDSVDHWLPGVVRGHGHDGRRITVRQLLNHTSGIYNFTADEDFVREFFLKDGFFKHRYDTREPRQLVDIAMKHKPDFPPGTSWNYSNTNYILAGMIVEKATGHSYAREVRRRVIKPLRLHDTTVPRTDPRVPQPSGRAYSKLGEDPAGPSYDVTELNPSSASSAGGMISDSDDLNRFYSALLRGRLLPKKQLAEMTTTVPVEGIPGARYGLGLIERKLSCGTVVWGHGGGIHGSTSEAVTTKDGRHSLAFNFNGDWTGDSEAVIEAEFCGK